MPDDLEYTDFFRGSIGYGLGVTGVGNTASAGVTIAAGVFYYAPALGYATAPQRVSLGSSTVVPFTPGVNGNDVYLDLSTTLGVTRTYENIGSAAPNIAASTIRLAKVTIGPMGVPLTPTLTSATTGTISSIPDGTYFAVLTAVGPGGLESSPSATPASATTTSGQVLQVSVSSFPAGAEYANVYIGTSSTGPWFLQGQLTSAGSTLTLTSYASSGRALASTMPSPPAAPTTGASGGGHIPAGTYSVVITLVTAAGVESTASPVASQSLSTNQGLTVTAPAFASGSVNVYVALSSGGPFYLQGQISSSGGALTLSTLSGSTVTPPTTGLSIVSAITDMRPFAERPNGPLLLNILDFGADPTRTTDCSAAITDALQVLASNLANNGLSTASVTPFAAGGGTLCFPGGTYLVNDQLTLPNSLGATPTTPQPQGAPLQAPIRLTGAGLTQSTVYKNTSKLVLRYGGSGTGGKLNSLGAGVLEIDHLAITNDQAASDSTPFLYATNSLLRIHDNSFTGATSARTSDTIQNYLYLGQGCVMDAIQLGGADWNHNIYDGTLNSNFQGYTSSIEHNTFDNCRRVVVVGANANSITVDGNAVPTGSSVAAVPRSGTTNTPAITASTSPQTVTLTPSGPPAGSFGVGSIIAYDTGASLEVVEVTAISPSNGLIANFTATFASNHNANALMTWQPAGGSLVDPVWAACIDVRAELLPIASPGLLLRCRRRVPELRHRGGVRRERQRARAALNHAA